MTPKFSFSAFRMHRNTMKYIIIGRNKLRGIHLTILTIKVDNIHTNRT